MYFGALIKNKNNYSIAEGTDITESNFDSIICILAGPNQNLIITALNKVLRAAEDIDNERVPTCDPISGSYYVYAYFDSNTTQNWNNIFYVGKGKVNRQFAHLDSRSKRFISKTPLVSTRKKDQYIDKWLSEHISIGSSKEQIRKQAKNKLVSCLYNDLTELEAFFLEKFLIMRGRRAQDLANETAGNDKLGEYTSICVPKIYDRNNSEHHNIWSAAVMEFWTNPHSPIINNTIRPSLTFIGIESNLDKLAQCLSSFGLVGCDMSNKPENRLNTNQMVRNYCGVTGAGDAKISFAFEDLQNTKPYRFDFRIPPAGLEVTMTLRPLTCRTRENTQFINYFNNAVVNRVSMGSLHTKAENLNLLYPNTYIKNRNNWPYYKPLSWNSDGTKYSTFFPIDQPDSSVNSKVHWLQGHDVTLSLKDAVKIISEAF
jgi:hypothetical protein